MRRKCLSVKGNYAPSQSRITELLDISEGNKMLLALSFLVAAILVSFGCYRIFKYTELDNWVKHIGTVLDIREECKSVKQQYYDLKYFYPVIKYKYTINETEFIFSSVSPHIRNVWLCEKNDWGNLLDNQSKFWHGWQKGTDIDIFVNSEKPTESYVINRQSKLHRSHNYAILLGGIIVFIIAVVLATYT